MEYFFTCPYCWQEISVLIDLSVESQSYVEDCEICCNPILIKYTIQSGEVVQFEAEKNQ
ncbi:MAG: CPXCG motif-containing cysteine-rich protein [Ignavibacteria bacterium]|nr:CPXCG motif-containing cysteine-rich protein [Ignavibacteria bacterium]